jgi:hypothetical protein
MFNRYVIALNTINRYMALIDTQSSIKLLNDHLNAVSSMLIKPTTPPEILVQIYKFHFDHIVSMSTKSYPDIARKVSDSTVAAEMQSLKDEIQSLKDELKSLLFLYREDREPPARITDFSDIDGKIKKAFSTEIDINDKIRRLEELELSDEESDSDNEEKKEDLANMIKNELNAVSVPTFDNLGQ